ncbi:MAG: hypothetical protein M0P58_11765 [Bacteroidales bacterium]|nr:hypothetical protein [Bacteroidales bacterium]
MDLHPDSVDNHAMGWFMCEVKSAKSEKNNSHFTVHTSDLKYMFDSKMFRAKTPGVSQPSHG